MKKLLKTDAKFQLKEQRKYRNANKELLTNSQHLHCLMYIPCKLYPIYHAM